MLGFTSARVWVYPKAVRGRFQRMHRLSGILLHVILFLTPWISIGGHPALRVDLPARRVYVLGGVFTAVDGYLLVLLGFLAAFSLFFFTSLFGRLWCGYLCPQTVLQEEWTRRIERWIEGDRNKRIKRDAKGLHFDLVWRKGVKWVLFAAVALVVSASFQSFFAGAWSLWTLQAGPVDYALVGIFGAVWFVDFAWFREQMCNYVCPYARFQGALTDQYSLVVSYDAERGEPRAPGKVAADEGRCVDCSQCVYVCPQGIDIRNGFQLECVNCGRCIDACEAVQQKIGNEPLVKYTTQAAGGNARWIRPRTVVYATLLTSISAVLVAMVALHTPFEASVNRLGGELYQVDTDGAVRNTFMVRIRNSDPSGENTQFEVAVDGLPTEAEVIATSIELGPEEMRTVPLIVRFPADRAPTSLAFAVEVRSQHDRQRLETTFKGPGPGVL